MYSAVFYDDANDYDESFYRQELDYEEYDYIMDEGDTFIELYENCLLPVLRDTAYYLIPLFLSSIIFRIAALNGYIPRKVFHGVSVIIGIYTVQKFIPECLYLLLVFIILSFVVIHLLKRYMFGFGAFLPSLFFILYCEFAMEPVTWHKVRGAIMISAMKAISFAIDTTKSNNVHSVYEYAGYMFNGATCIFGPWVSFEEYNTVYSQSQSIWILPKTLGYFIGAFSFLSISSCWTQWMMSENNNKWLLAYREALSFRTSHYFVCFMASGILLLSGYSDSVVSITKPLEMELPRSLVQVVVSWNIPMHYWLKIYIFRPSCRQLGKFGAVVITYLTSSLLHGLNFQLASVLLSLGFYTYVEYQLRATLASAFDACIGAKKCKSKCSHSRNSSNCIWVILTNFSFSILSIFHLAYLGLMFDTSELQDTGYSYSHTIKKWSQLGFASHWVAVGTYFAYFLIA